MRGPLRHIPFIICVLATILIQRTEHQILFGLAALTAFANLFSSQFLCALDGCRPRTAPGSKLNPGHIALYAYWASSALGFIVLLYAVAELYWNSG